MALLGLAMVLGLWQQVDRACLTDEDADVAGALADCDPVPLADDEEAAPRTPATGDLELRPVADR